jgi:hypothetical protein
MRMESVEVSLQTFLTSASLGREYLGSRLGRRIPEETLVSGPDWRRATFLPPAGSPTPIISVWSVMGRHNSTNLQLERSQKWNRLLARDAVKSCD